MTEPAEFIEPTLLPGDWADAAAHPERALKVVDLYKAVIGPLRQGYYLKQFARQEAGTGWRWSWHWGAFASALNWLVFRQMWNWVPVYAGLLAVLGLAAVCVGNLLGWGMLPTLGLGLGAWLLASVVAGLCANALYYRHCMALIHRVLVNGVDRETAAETLAAQASGPRRWLGQVLVNVSLLLMVPALTAFAPVSVTDAWAWLGGGASGTEAAPGTPDVPQPAPPDPERRVLPPGTATPTLQITPAQTTPPAPLQPAPAPAPPSEPAPVPAPTAVPETQPETKPDAQPVMQPLPQPVQPSDSLPALPVSEALASAQAGLVLPADPPSATVTSVPLPPPQPAPAPTPDVPSTQRPASTNTGFAVQVGIFGEPANVERAMSALRLASLPAYADAITYRNKPSTRVRVGPYRTQAEAQQAAEQIGRMGLPGVVVPLQRR